MATRLASKALRTTIVFGLAFGLTGCVEVARRVLMKESAEAGAERADAPPEDASSVASSVAEAGPEAEPPPSPAQLEAAFAQLDRNGDARLDGIEVLTCGCASAERDGTKGISKAEYLAAGLLGKLPRSATSPGASPAQPPAPTTVAPPPQAAPAQPAPAQPAQPAQPAPAQPVAGGLPPGSYHCFGLVGSFYGARGTLVIVDGARYAHGTDGSGGGNYAFDPATKQIRFTSGLFADPEKVKSARQVSAKEIQMRTGKGGFYTWDCKR